MMKKIYILIILNLIANAFAQQPTQEWVARFFRPTPNSDSKGPFLVLDKNANSYVAGTDKVNDSINILVIKFNSSGVQQWAKYYKYPGEGYFVPYGLALDTSGNAYVTSISGQSVFNNLNILTVKFNAANGAIVWAKKYIGNNGKSQCEDIKTDRLDNIYVVGSADSSLLCIKYNINGDSVWVRKYHPLNDLAYGHASTLDDSLNIIITGERDHCVTVPPPGGCFDTLLTVKYNTDGILRWAKTYFYPINPSISIGTKITNDQNGNVFIAGKTRNSSGLYIYLTLKLDRNGLFQWSSIYSGPVNWDNFISEIEMDRLQNSVFITGSVRGSSSFSDCCIIKYNALTGDSIWTRIYNGLNNDIDGARDIKVDSSGNCYMAGGTTSNTGADLLTIRYSPQGNINWLTTYNGPSSLDDFGIKLKLDNNRNVYVLGGSENDYIVIKYSQPSGIKLIGNEIPQIFTLFQNYPNPFNSKTKIRLSIPLKSNIKIEIYDLLGRIKEELIKQELQPGEYEMSFEGENYSTSVYFYRLIANGIIVDTKKFIIVK